MKFFRAILLFVFAYHVSAEDTEENPSRNRTRGRYGITYGKNADFSKYPFYTRIWTKCSGSTYFCGGTIVDYNKVLTAGHCVYGCQEFLVCVGSGVTLDTTYCFYVTDMTKVCVHKGFHEAQKVRQFNDDLALITIDGNIFRACPNGVAIAPFLDTCPTASCETYKNSVGVAIGCGETHDSMLSKVLQEAGQKPVTTAEGLKTFGIISPSSKYSLCFTVSSTSDYRMSTCSGDSGSPLLYPNPVTGDMEVVGVLSFGTADCDTGSPSAFTFLAKYKNFIKHNYECVSLSAIQAQLANVQSSFNAYRINMKPRNEEIWKNSETMRFTETTEQTNTMKPNVDFSKYDISNTEKPTDDEKKCESKIALIKMFFKMCLEFFKALMSL
ncbi:trypsin-like [Culicoides brevitarsis]|uniref:trypsin-like n=1 Tax=Culicoides brevitarsis TaxID=469753 RepID=UPI00307C64FD